jgi:hypothetical protein
VEINEKFLAPCGLYCGVCAVYYATRDNNQKFRDRLVSVYKGKLPDSEGLSVEDMCCEGCLSERPFGFCEECFIRDCTQSKGYAGCHECDDFPCHFIDDFPLPVGKKVIMRAIPYRRKWGTEKWVQDEEARYICSGCGHKLFRGVKSCNKCKVEVDLD